MEDFLIKMGYTGLTGRLKRLNDQFVYQTKQFYDDLGVDIEPNWHMIFLLLEKEERLTVMDMANATRISHPGIIKLLNKMKKNGYVSSKKDVDDQRKRYWFLTKKAKEKLPELHTYWEAGDLALRELLENNDELLTLLQVVEKNIYEIDYTQRMKNNMK
ncbi:MarR family transcriptional regulator [Flavobacteriaceae bacterium F08102]|nr:MarR family transcriptional regulator [Flavobacteriaceae bacterium F08102]